MALVSFYASPLGEARRGVASLQRDLMRMMHRKTPSLTLPKGRVKMILGPTSFRLPLGGGQEGGEKPHRGTSHGGGPTKECKKAKIPHPNPPPEEGGKKFAHCGAGHRCPTARARRLWVRTLVPPLWGRLGGGYLPALTGSSEPRPPDPARSRLDRRSEPEVRGVWPGPGTPDHPARAPCSGLVDRVRR